MRNDLHGILRWKVLQYWDDHTAIGDDSYEEDRPLSRVFSHEGDLISVLETLGGKEVVPACYLCSYLTIGIALSFVITQSGDRPVLLEAIFK